MQWLVLQRLIPQAHQWVLASLVGGAMLAISSLVIGAAVGGPLGGAVIGAALGAMQWLILRRQVSRAYLYLLSSIVGFALALTEGEAIGFTVDGAAGWLTGGTLFGILVGVITGAVLFWLLRQPILDI